MWTTVFSMFRTMLATHSPAKRTFCSAADVYSNLDFDTFDFNLGVFHRIPLLSYHDTQKLNFSTISPPYKRARPSQPDHLAEEWSWSRATTPDVQHKFSAAATTSFPCPPVTSLPSYLIDVEANEDGCDNEKTACFLSNASVSSASGDMPAKRPVLPSNAGKHKSIDKSDLEDSGSAKLNSSISDKNNRGVSSRRRPVAGENIPRLAATWRETTSSRGSDNTFRVRSQVNANDVTASMSDVSFSGVATDGLESNNDYNLLLDDWSLVCGPNAIEGQQTLYSAPQLPHSELSPHNISALTPYIVPGNIEGDFDFLPISTHQYPDTGSEMANNYISCTANSDIFAMEPTNILSEPNLVLNPLTSLSTSSSIHLGSVSSSVLPNDTSHSNDNWNSSSCLPELEDFNWGNISQASNTDTTSFWFPGISPVAAQTEADINLETLDTQWLSAVPENNDHSSMGSPLRNLIDIDNNLLGSLDLDQLRIPSKDLSDLGRIYERNIPQTGVSTSSLPEMRSKFDRWENKRHYKRKTTENRLPFRRTGFPSESIDSSGLSTGRFLSLPIEGTLESSADLQSNDGSSGSIELLEVMSGSAESEGNEPFDRNTISNDLSRRKRLSSGNSATSHPRTGSRFNEVSNLNNSADNNSAVLVIAEDTNDTQPDVQKFLAEANQQSRPPKAGSSRNSPSRKVATTWEHTFVVQKKFTEAASESPPERTSQTLGRRRRPLSEDTRKRAKEMRKTRSCLRCKVSKIACTPGEICVPCLKLHSSMLSGMICIRAHLIDYLNLFLPEQAVRPFQQASIDQLMAQKISRFSNDQFKVYLSSGPNYSPISVTVRTFRTKDRSFLVFKKIMIDGASKETTFVESYSPPLGITDFSQDLRGNLTKHIQNIVEGKRDYGEVLYGNTSQLTWDVHEAVRLYQRTNPTNQLLQNVLILYAMQFFMTKSIVMLRDASEQVPDPENIAGPVELNTQNPNLRMINIQMKHVMHSLICKTYVEVLTELEKDLRPKEPALWAPTFCCILMLCMCAEMVQITSDLRVVNALDDISKSTDGLDKNGNSASRADSIDVCHKLDGLPIASIESSFHLIYRTIKLKDGSKREQGFNPIRDGLDIVRKAKLGKDVEEFVDRMIAIVAKHRNELKHEATIPSFNRSPNVLEDHNIFRKHNSGRLVSRFIQSML